MRYTIFCYYPPYLQWTRPDLLTRMSLPSPPGKRAFLLLTKTAAITTHANPLTTIVPGLLPFLLPVSLNTLANPWIMITVTFPGETSRSACLRIRIKSSRCACRAARISKSAVNRSVASRANGRSTTLSRRLWRHHL